MHLQVRSARIAMPGGTAMLHRGRLFPTWLTTPSPLPRSLLRSSASPPPFCASSGSLSTNCYDCRDSYVYTEDRSAYIPCSPSPYPCPLRSTTPRIAISTAGIAMSTSRSPRLHRRLIEMFCFVLSFFLRTTTILRRPRSRPSTGAFFIGCRCSH